MTQEKNDRAPLPPLARGGDQAPRPGEAAAERAGKDGDKGRNTTGKRPDPTRYGDWEKNGRCIDF